MEKVLITGGGTGGHLSVAKTFANELKKLDIDIFYIGSINGQEVSWFNDDSLFKDRLFLKSGTVIDKKGIKRLLALKDIYIQSKLAKKFIRKHKVTKTISVGGYSAAPGVFATLLSNISLFIHEQNSIIGNLNKVSFFFAKKFYSSYHNFSTIKDYPINNDIFKYQRVRENIKTIIFLGGSQGAITINDFALKIAPILDKLDIKIIHQSGKKDFNRVKSEYKRLNIDAFVFDFSNDLYSIIKQADFAVSRAGASTLWELVASGVFTLFIPYKYAANNHQYHNAKFLLNKKLAILKTENELDNFDIKEIFNYDIKYISENLISLINKDGAKKIIEDILT